MSVKFVKTHLYNELSVRAGLIITRMVWYRGRVSRVRRGV